MKETVPVEGFVVKPRQVLLCLASIASVDAKIRGWVARLMILNNTNTFCLQLITTVHAHACRGDIHDCLQLVIAISQQGRQLRST
jgi:hypothetical protein